MPGSDENRTNTEWVTASKFYRRRPGLGWLLGLLLVPLLLGAIGYSGLDTSSRDVDAALPSVDPSATLTMPSAAPSAAVPLSIVRNGNDLNDFQDEQTSSAAPNPGLIVGHVEPRQP